MTLKLRNVRLTFADAIFRAKSFKNDDGTTGKARFSGMCLIDPVEQAKTIKVIEAEMLRVAEEAWPGKGKIKIKKFKKTLKLPLHDGDEKSDEYEAFENMMYLSAASKVKPRIVDRDRQDLSEQDGRPYSGCYVTMIVDIYAQKKQSGYGERINAGLKGIQFVKDGEPFGGGKPADPDDFDDLGLDDEDDDDLDDDDDDLV